MRRLRSDALWHKLTPEQKAKIKHWFFVENLSYCAVHQRMREELGITCSLSIIGPMYHHCNELRSQERETILQKLTDVITAPGTNLDLVRTDSMAVIGGHLLQRSMQHANTREIVALGKVMLQGEGRDIQRERLDLMNQRLNFERAHAALSEQNVEKT